MRTSNLTVTITMEQANVRTDMIAFHQRKAEESRNLSTGAHLKRDQADYTVRAMVHDEMARFWETVEIV